MPTTKGLKLLAARKGLGKFIPQVRIVRLETSSEHGTFGVLLVQGAVFCVTLEPYSRDNCKSLSCIPTGQYRCIWRESQKHGATFAVLNVQDRYDILFHRGNVRQETEGCILLGRQFGTLGADRAILISRATFKHFMEMLNEVYVFNLTIVEGY